MEKGEGGGRPPCRGGPGGHGVLAVRGFWRKAAGRVMQGGRESD